MSTDNKTTERAASPSKAKSRRAGAAAASGTERPSASTKRAMLIGMLERGEGASVTEIGQHLSWLPHTVRAAITGLRHAGREVTRGKDQSGRSVYRLVPVETTGR
jgi:predicted ArsR family transcriptional regulator